MPRFFCHLRRPDGLSADTAGGEYADLEEAYLDVLHAIEDVIADYAAEGESTTGFSYEIADENGQTLMVLPFSPQRRH